MADADCTLPTAHPRLRIALLQTADRQRLIADMGAGAEVCGVGVSDEAIRRWLHEHVPEYGPS